MKSAKRRSCASKRRCNRLFPAAVLSIAAADIRIKQYVEDNVPQGHDRPTLGGRIILRKVYNSGAAFGLLHGSPRLVTGLSALLGALLAARDALLLKRRGRILEKTGMALLTGGALSNLSDRVLRGKVVDYFAFGSRWKKWSRLTFNLGDLCIAAGAVLALLGRPAGLPGKKKEHPSGSGNQEQTAYKG